ncbi:MAG: DUF1801 domain-containing protein [Armatimonadetes bacterium]|nr:DUF1801 domain-containing protein [Armatimonadota bacterium]
MAESKRDTGFSAEEKAAMKARAKELKAQAAKEDGEKMVLDAIATMPQPGRQMAERLHILIKGAAPHLAPKTWYGMPSYANEEGKVVLFFRGGERFKERYLTLGFNQDARLDDGHMWPIAYAITELTQEDEDRVSELVKKAVG